MKKEIHPTYYSQATFTCACGNAFVVGSTQESIRIEMCSACHPFYTGKQKFVDTARRVEKFQEKMKKVQATAKARGTKKAKRAIRAKKKQDEGTTAEEKTSVTGKKKSAKKTTKKSIKKEESK